VALGSAGDSIAKLQTYGAPMCSAMYGCCAYAVCGMRYAVCGMPCLVHACVRPSRHVLRHAVAPHAART